MALGLNICSKHRQQAALELALLCTALQELGRCTDLLALPCKVRRRLPKPDEAKLPSMKIRCARAKQRPPLATCFNDVVQQEPLRLVPGPCETSFHFASHTPVVHVNRSASTLRRALWSFDTSLRNALGEALQQRDFRASRPSTTPCAGCMRVMRVSVCALPTTSVLRHRSFDDLRTAGSARARGNFCPPAFIISLRG